MYEVHKVRFYEEDGKEIESYHIMNNKLPVFKANQFLDRKKRGSVNTCKQYAYKLVRYFNYLEEIRNKNFKQATKEDVVKFINNILFDVDGNLFINQSKTTYTTANHYITVIKEFYKFLEDDSTEEVSMSLYKDKGYINKHSFMYGQIWSLDNSTLLNAKISRIKGSKEYIKWYTPEEISTILDNLPTLRDKSVFLLTLEGLRIDEVLSLRIFDYDDNEPCVYPYRSKGRETGNVGSTVIISRETADMINNYMFNERDEALIKFQEKFPEKAISDALFINLQERDSLGSDLKYNNFLKILKYAAKKAGLDSKQIRTHSGRSTKTMELLHHQVLHPEDGLTDEHIRQIMRWNSASSIIPYVNTQDKRIALETAKKIKKSKEDK